MKITFWGSRGSIPVSGRQYLKYGGDTACVEIRTQNDEIIIIDAGTGIKNLGNKLIAEKRKKAHIFFTHAHWDHLIGFPFFKPIYLKDFTLDILGCKYSQDSIRAMLSNVMDPPLFPVNLGELKSTIVYNGGCVDTITIDSVTVDPIFLNHPNNGMGYRLTENGKSFVFLTDNEIGIRSGTGRELAHVHESGRTYREYVDFSRNAGLFVHDAEYTPEEYYHGRISWGHSSYLDALELAIDAGVKHFGLYHHNQDRTDDEIDDIVDKCNAVLGERKIEMECCGIRQGFTVVI